MPRSDGVGVGFSRTGQWQQGGLGWQQVQRYVSKWLKQWNGGVVMDASWVRVDRGGGLMSHKGNNEQSGQIP